MKHRIFLAAVTVAALLAAASSARAADTVLLGGVGSATRFETDTPTMTLEGLPHDDATFEKTWGYYRPRFYRPWYGYGFYRPWYGWGGWGGYRPWFYRPWYGYGFYRPWFYRSFYYGWPGYGGAFAYLPISSTAGYGSVESLDAGTPVTHLTLPSTPIAAAQYRETTPAPLEPGHFRYDGSPERPVPLPGTAPAPTVDEPLSGRPAVNRLVSQPKKKLAYPAYGEMLPKPGGRPGVIPVNSARR
jgi:hypothetical protein